MLEFWSSSCTVAFWLEDSCRKWWQQRCVFLYRSSVIRWVFKNILVPMITERNFRKPTSSGKHFSGQIFWLQTFSISFYSDFDAFWPFFLFHLCPLHDLPSRSCSLFQTCISRSVVFTFISSLPGWETGRKISSLYLTYWHHASKEKQSQICLQIVECSVQIWVLEAQMPIF